ncbi:hypothetical protein UFOVP54_187 [uncultured Caudovirales phage]|uniref:Uncharacterized protein n=1 Tax=uncultured Caudovirales phage TaxID=2100421 RepID=A0A6J5L0L5_9CAUD|nr:hypothetical protein UFOVP54_187 [uncultured Caudovirales phage]
MTNQITQKFTDLLGPITEDRLTFGNYHYEGVHGMGTVVELTGQQKQQAEQLLKDHFKFKQVEWIDYIGGASEPGKAVVTKTTKLGDDNTTYEGKTGYIFQISFTPRIYDPKTVYNAVKDGCAMTPTIYNPETFTPYKKIILTWSPEQAQDFPVKNSEEVMKQTLRDQLDKVLANPEEYMPEGFRACMLRFAAK